MANIPGLTYTIRQSLDRLQYQANTYNEEFVQRLLLMIGHPDYFTTPAYGIVSEQNPETAVSGTTTVPLTVSVNNNNTESVDISPGMAVTKDGMWILIPDTVRQIELDDPEVGITNVVYLRYVLDPGDSQLNDYLDPVIPVTWRPGSPNSASEADVQVDIDTLDAYQNYDEDVRNSLVPIAIATMQNVEDPLTSTVTTQMSIDHTRGNYSWNRPWFSAVDVEHRGQIGTGVSTATNPHALSQNDLTVGDFSPLQLQLDHGMIVADDRSIAKIPGVRCEVAIPYASIKTDDGAGSKTSVPNAQYVELTNYPVRLGKVWVTDGITETDYAGSIVVGTNRVVIWETVPTDWAVHMYYTKVDACEPPVGSNEILFSTKNPSAEELIIAGGSGFTALTNTQEAFADAQKFPMIYEILVDGTGSLIKSPQVIYCYKLLTTIATSDTFDIDLYGPARIMCGLADASGAGTMVVKVHLYGKDANGNSIEHIFEFDSTWVDPGPVPKNTITPQAVNSSSQVFSSLDQIVIDEATDAGPGAAIMMWASHNPYDTYDKLKDGCHIAEVMWDGLRLAETRDKRIISTTVRDFLLKAPANDSLMYIANTLAGGNSTVYMEDFRAPSLHDMVPNNERYDTLPYALPMNNISKLRVGSEGWYQTRALDVKSGSGATWRVVMVPLEEVRSEIYFQYQNPPLVYAYISGVWGSLTTTAVPGMRNTYEVTFPSTPDMIKVAVNTVDYIGMLVFG